MRSVKCSIIEVLRYNSW